MGRYDTNTKTALLEAHEHRLIIFYAFAPHKNKYVAQRSFCALTDDVFGRRIWSPGRGRAGHSTTSLTGSSNLNKFSIKRLKKNLRSIFFDIESISMESAINF